MPEYVCGVKKFSYLTALTFAVQEVPLEKAAGKVCARNAASRRPVSRSSSQGEVIGKETAECLKRAKNTFGVKNGKISVIKIGGRV